MSSESQEGHLVVGEVVWRTRSSSGGSRDRGAHLKVREVIWRSWRSRRSSGVGDVWKLGRLSRTIWI